MLKHESFGSKLGKLFLDLSQLSADSSCIGLPSITERFNQSFAEAIHSAFKGEDVVAVYRGDVLVCLSFLGVRSQSS